VLSEAELKELQKVLLEMLIELDRICRKHSICYALDGGTLLGAVRHGGFIPWDDDLDVVMTRPEYVRFRAACRTELDSGRYFFQDNTTDPDYPWGFGRIRRLGSEFVRVGQEHLRMRTGIFLDIFPRDNVPDAPWLRVLHNSYCFILRKLLYAETGTVTGKTALLRAWYRLLQRIPRGFVFRRLDSLARHWNSEQTELMRTLTFPILPKGQYGYKREWFEETAPILFEGLEFFGVKDYDGYLTCLYGDYMTPPPPEKRHWHPVSKFRLPD
jgi:lipopolysaccharide cholinephosphotransferase